VRSPPGGKGSLYYYIQSKEDLLFDVIKAVHEEGLASIESLAAGEATRWSGCAASSSGTSSTSAGT
jgi:AcrR family transcriptional regulator